MAEATGQHFTRISRIENGIKPPTERNIRDWCQACGAQDQIPDLIATAEHAEQFTGMFSRRSSEGSGERGGLLGPGCRPTGSGKIAA